MITKHTILNQEITLQYAQAIPICTNDNLTQADQTLKGNTKMCYGKHGDNMVIITKNTNRILWRN